ncbi:PadR family transcriptional regulator [Vibrio sp. PNB22_3_1]
MSLIALALGSASKGNVTGYEVFINLSNESSFNYWPASHQQIYREFNKLYIDGYLALEVVGQEGKPDKKIYSITELGLDRLKELSCTPPKLEKFRDEMVVKYHNIMALDADGRQRFWEMQAEYKSEMLSRFDFIEAQINVLDSKKRTSGIEDLASLIMRLRLLKERNSLEMDIHWLDMAEKQIRSHPEYRSSVCLEPLQAKKAIAV